MRILLAGATGAIGRPLTEHGDRLLTEETAFGEPSHGPTAPHIDAMATNEPVPRSEPIREHARP